LKIKQLILDAMFIALFVVLSLYATINTGLMKFTFNGLPVILAGVMFGPVHGLLVGFAGAFLEQLLTYGLGPTTMLWVIPAMARGLLVGGYAKHRGYNLKKTELLILIVISSVVVTTLNTGALYLDSMIFDYYAKIFDTVLIYRYLAGIITAVLYAVVVPIIHRLLSKHLKLGK